ncbi:transposase [Halomonas sp. QHL1]|uniref:transposase n=1 Tax=Halomonas sp. QHL1 TaxID=1123773 RepID=UPI002677148E|nr:transposase [Halomonas sp. QHL1]
MPHSGSKHQEQWYHQCNVVERLFSWLKEKRWLCTHYEKLASSFRTMATLASSSVVCGPIFRQNGQLT